MIDYEHDQGRLFDTEKRLAEMESDIRYIKEKVGSLESSIKDIILAWNTASGVVSFVKWVAGAATAVMTVIAIIKLGLWKP